MRGSRTTSAVNPYELPELAPPPERGFYAIPIPAEPVSNWLSECHQKLVGCPVAPASAADGPRLCWTTARELGTAMLAYASNTDDQELLDRAILLLQRAHDEGPGDGDPLAQNSYQLGVALFARHRRYGRPSDLAAVITVLENVRRRLPAGRDADNSPYAALCLGLLATAVRSQAGLDRTRSLDLPPPAMTAGEICLTTHGW